MLPTSLMTTLQFQIAWDFWFGLRPAYSKLRLQEAPPGCGPFLAAKNSNSHMVFQWIAQKGSYLQLFEEIIHIQGGIKELNTKMLLLILSELLTVRREFFARLVFRAWWGSFLTVLVGVFKARSPTMLSFPALHILKYTVCSLRKKCRLTL